MNLFRALLTVSGFTLLSRVTGLARETLIARAFGASQYTDAFYVAFRIPNLLRRIPAEGAFSQAFVPILAEFKNQQGHDATKALVDATMKATFSRTGANAGSEKFLYVFNTPDASDVSEMKMMYGNMMRVIVTASA